MISLCVMGVAMITGIYAGYKKGMIKIVLSCLSLLITMLIVVAVAPTVKNMISESEVYTSIEQTTKENLENQGVFKKASEDKMVYALKLPDPVKEEILKNKTASRYASMGVDNVKDYIIKSFTDVVLTAIVYIVLFVIIFALVSIGIHVFDIIGKLPIIKQFNELGGAIIGGVEALLFIWLVLIIISAFGNSEFATQVYNDINSNAIAKFVYDNNIFIKIIASAL